MKWFELAAPILESQYMHQRAVAVSALCFARQQIVLHHLAIGYGVPTTTTNAIEAINHSLVRILFKVRLEISPPAVEGVGVVLTDVLHIKHLELAFLQNTQTRT